MSGLAAATAVAVAVAIALVLNGPPYWYGWWLVIGGLFAAAMPASAAVALLVEWVIAGYSELPQQGEASRSGNRA